MNKEKLILLFVAGLLSVGNTTATPSTKCNLSRESEQNSDLPLSTVTWHDGNDQSSLNRKDFEKTIKGLINQVEKGTDPSILNKIPGHTNGLLRMEIQMNHGFKRAQRLLQAGADPNFYDGICYPLENAKGKNKVALLLQYGANPQLIKRSVLHHQFLENTHDGIQALQLLLQNGENVHKRIDGHMHLLAFKLEPRFTETLYKTYISYLIQHGSNPNELCSPDVSNETVYEYFENNERASIQQWALFMRKERGWYLMKPLLITHSKQKEQDDVCYISKLPRELLVFIGKLALNHKDAVIG